MAAEAVLRPVFNELCFNLESFNPAFTHCLLMVRKGRGNGGVQRREGPAGQESVWDVVGTEAWRAEAGSDAVPSDRGADCHSLVQ